MVTPEEASGVVNRGGTESFPADAGRLKSLYTILLIILGIALLMLIAAWFWLLLQDKTVPEGMPVLAATIGGGLVGVLAQPSASR